MRSVHVLSLFEDTDPGNARTCLRESRDCPESCQEERGGLLISNSSEWEPGFLDRTGRVVMAPAFADERDFFMVWPRWRCRKENEDSFTPRFSEVRDFTDDLAPVRIGQRWEYIDTSGRTVGHVRPQW
jgi:hypothetical protein